MKKLLMIGLIVALLMVIVGGVGVAYAQFRGLNRNMVTSAYSIRSGDEIVRQFGYGYGGMMGGLSQGDSYGPGMMGGRGFTQGDEYGPGMMGGRGFSRGEGYGPGMMGGRGFAEGNGPLHDYMVSAFANAVGLSVEEVETRLTNGETMREIAIAQGTPEADLFTLMTEVRQAALDQAVADGAITQAQADFMLERMSNYSGPGFGPGYGEGCPMWDGDEN